MPNKEYTHIEILIDRSGSMSGKEKDVVGGINSLLEQQKEDVQQNGGVVNATIRSFDGFVETISDNVNVLHIKKLKISDIAARGGTALFDAVGRSINELGIRLSKLEDKDRPGGVLFVIFTDGQNNQSQEFTLEKIKSMVETQEKVYSWQFIFLGEGLDAFQGGLNTGFSAGKSATFDSYQNTGSLLGTKVNVYRSMLKSEDKAVASGASAGLDFTAQEREQLKTK